MPVVVNIDCSRIADWNSFHDVFQEAFGFPDFYGRNMDAWVDCLSYVDDPGAAMTMVHSNEGEVVTIQLANVGAFIERCPEQYAALIECAAFVNWRRVERNEAPVLAISFYK